MDAGGGAGNLLLYKVHLIFNSYLDQIFKNIYCCELHFSVYSFEKKKRRNVYKITVSYFVEKTFHTFKNIFFVRNVRVLQTHTRIGTSKPEDRMSTWHILGPSFIDHHTFIDV